MAGVFIGTWVFVNVSRRAFLMWTFYVPAALLVLLILWKDMPPMMAIAVISAFALVLAMSIVAEYSYPPELFPTELRASGVGLTIASSRIGVRRHSCSPSSVNTLAFTPHSGPTLSP